MSEVAQLFVGVMLQAYMAPTMKAGVWWIVGGLYAVVCHRAERGKHWSAPSTFVVACAANVAVICVLLGG